MARSAKKGSDQTLLQALACGATVENAARRAEIGERTAYRRLADPKFRQRVEEQRREMVQRTTGMLTGAGMGSVKVLVDLQQDASINAGVRRRAARDVLEMGTKFSENATWDERIIAIEQRLAAALDSPPNVA